MAGSTETTLCATSVATGRNAAYNRFESIRNNCVEIIAQVNVRRPARRLSDSVDVNENKTRRRWIYGVRPDALLTLRRIRHVSGSVHMCVAVPRM